MTGFETSRSGMDVSPKAAGGWLTLDGGFGRAVGGNGPYRGKLNRDAEVAVADFAFEAARFRDWSAEEAEAVHATFPGPQAGGIGAVEGDEQRVVAGALAGDDIGLAVGVRRDADAAALADGVVMQATVFADDLAVGGPDNRAGMVRHIGF